MKVAVSVLVAVAVAAAYHLSKSNRDETAISPTAHYTGHVWVRNGLSDPRLDTTAGRILYTLLEPIMLASRIVNGPTVEQFLLARHRLIDYQIEQLIDSGKVNQILEIAAGLSPRGLKFRKRYGNKIKYIETDLPSMADLKKGLINGSLDDTHHRVLPLNLLLTHGPGSLKDLVSRMDTAAGTVIVTEGLLNYFDERNVRSMWRVISHSLGSFSYGAYISDIHLSQHSDWVIVRSFRWLLSIFVRGSVHLLFPDRLAAEWALIDTGFLSAIVHRPQDWADEVEACGFPGARLVHIITALVNPKE